MSFWQRLITLIPNRRDAAVFALMLVISLMLGSITETLLSAELLGKLQGFQEHAYCEVSKYRPAALASRYMRIVWRDTGPATVNSLAAEQRALLDAAARVRSSQGGAPVMSLADDPASPPMPRIVPNARPIVAMPARPPDPDATDCAKLDAADELAHPDQANKEHALARQRQKLTAFDMGARLRSLAPTVGPGTAGDAAAPAAHASGSWVTLIVAFGELGWESVTQGALSERMFAVLQLALGLGITAVAVGLAGARTFDTAPPIVRVLIYAVGGVAFGSLGAWAVQAAMQLALFAFGAFLGAVAGLIGAVHAVLYGSYFLGVKAAELRGHEVAERAVERGMERLGALFGQWAGR